MIAAMLAEEGVNIGLLARNMNRAGEVVERIKAIGPDITCSAFQADLLSSLEVSKTMERVAADLGGLDILINCAGDSARGGIEELDEEAWTSALAVKPLGFLRVTKAALPFLKKSDGGRIINIAGGHGKEPTAYSMMGGMANASALSFTKSLSDQLAVHGITVNAVCPGHTDTGRWTALIERTAREKGLNRADAENHLLQRVPLRRVVSPRDVAAAVAFLSSRHASMITGSILNVDGGRARSI